MIVLDTDVLSAVMSARPDEAVVAWLDGQREETLWLTAVTVFEVRFGIDLLPAGKRKRRLSDSFGTMLDEDFAGRILPFDAPAAAAAATIAARRRTAGRTVDFRDVEIAGTVLASKATLATRNTRHFVDLGITLVDPWAA
jgi:hypothetical protein